MVPGMQSLQPNGSMLMGGEKPLKPSPPGKPRKTAEVAPVEEAAVPDIRLDVSGGKRSKKCVGGGGGGVGGGCRWMMGWRKRRET